MCIRNNWLEKCNEKIKIKTKPYTTYKYLSVPPLKHTSQKFLFQKVM